MEQFFGYFRYGFFAGVYHLLFMLTLPFAILVALGGDIIVGIFIFLSATPVFRFLREKSILTKVVRSQQRTVKAQERYQNAQRREVEQFKKENPIEVVVYPQVLELSEYLDESGAILDNEFTERWIRLFFDENYIFKTWQFSPVVAEMVNTPGMMSLPFMDSAQMWGQYIQEQFQTKGECNLQTLPNSIITGPKFLVIGPDSKTYLAGSFEEE